MSRSALLAWLAAVSLVAPATIAQAATPAAEQLIQPVVHTRVTPPTPAPASRQLRTASAPTHAASERPAAADRLIVTFTAANAAAAAQAHLAAQATPIATAAQGQVQVVRVDPAHRDAALAAYEHQVGVKAVSVDRAISATELPNDPLYAEQSGAGYALGWSLDAIGAPTAWAVSHGDNVKVAVLDTGIYTAHPDLSGQVTLSQDFTGSAPSAVDGNGHGTHVAGIIAALENNGLGLAGVAPRAKLLNAKVLDDTGSGSMDNVISAIPWAVQQGAKVISMSLGAYAPCDTALQTTIDAAWNAGVVIVAAAGNHDWGSSQTAEMEPANCNHVIGVGASTIGGPSADSSYTEGPAWFSNDGPTVVLAAPGDTVYSTMLSQGGELNDPSGYGALSGTSMAAPQVAGAAALVWASPYGTSNEAVLSRLTSTADHIAGTGSDWIYGRVNAAAAIGLTALPAPAQVVDGLGAEASSQSSATSISAHWSAVPAATGYVYAIGSAPGLADVAGWTDNGATLAMTQTGLSLTNTATYYISVRAYNAQGVSSAVTASSGVQVLQPVAAVNIAAYQAATTQLSATWSAISGAADYEYAIGTAPGGTDVRVWTSTSGALTASANGLSLAPGATYVLSVRVAYAGGLRSLATSSSGTTILSAPVGVSASASGTSSITAAWNGLPGASGYEYAIGSSSGATDVVAWTNNGVGASVSRGGLSLADGHTYYVAIRAYDSVGGRTAAGVSAGVTVHAPSANNNGGGGGGGGGGHSGGGGGGGASPVNLGGGSGGGGASFSAPAPGSSAPPPITSAPAPATAAPMATLPPAPVAAAPIVVSTSSADGRASAGADSASGVVQLTLAPVPLTSSVPTPLGRLRLIDTIIGVTTADQNGLAVTPLTPLLMTIAPSDAALASVGGDATQLVIGYLDASGNWATAPTSVDATGHLQARVPNAAMVAIFRQAPTFWVTPVTDLPLVSADGSQVGTASAGAPVEVVAVQGTTYQVRLADGTLAGFDGTQSNSAPAPDALPPIPTTSEESLSDT